MDFDGAKPEIFTRFPSLVEQLPWQALGHWPTRIVAAPEFLAGGAELWIKRDDESSTVYGGNKVRKLEFILGDALHSGATRLVTTGAWGSHHVLATIIWGRAHGFEVDAIVLPQPITPAVLENLRLCTAAGGHLSPAASYTELPLRMAAARREKRVKWIPAGGSIPLGVLGYVSAGLEIARQCEQGECPWPDVIYLALGSCGTAAGLGLGLSLAGWRGRIVAVRVIDSAVCNHRTVRRLAQGAALLLRRAGIEAANWENDPELTVEHQFFGTGYGHPLAAAEEAIKSAAQIGVTLDSTYTAKAFAALMAHANAGQLAGKRVLFINTLSSADLTALRAQASNPAVLEQLHPSLRKLFS